MKIKNFILILSCATVLAVTVFLPKSGNKSMLFQELSEYFNRIEPVSSRLEITRLLSELFSNASAQEAKIISYLSLGQLHPPYLNVQFNFAEKNIAHVVQEILGIDKSEFNEELKKHGDLGSVVSTGNWRKKSNLTVVEVYNKLIEIEQITGTGSQEIKYEKVLNLLKELDPVSAKYVIRVLTDSLRLGFSDMTLIDAFSWLLVGDKSLRKDIENAYNMCVDIGKIGYIVKKEGIKGIKDIKAEVGIPIRPAAAERLATASEIIEKIGTCVAQPKLDGFRLQIHVDNSKKEHFIKFFSRNLVDMSHMFPDLVEAFKKLKVKTLICEGEAIAYDPNTGNFAPFQETVKRKRKHGIEETMAEYPLQVFLFDLLYLNDKLMLEKGYEERRDLLVDLFKNYPTDTIQVIKERKISDAKHLEDYFLEEISAGLEGLVVKKPNSIYQPGKRNFNWIKLKRGEGGHLSDTIDCVILGYNYGQGKRSHFGIGAFLVGVYNKEKDHFQTVAKVGTGMTDEEWKTLKKKCDHEKTEEKPKNIECDKNLYPDVWIWPKIVCEIMADEITVSPIHTAGKTEQTLGYALRFPRFMKYRLDKSATEATTVKELKELYGLQFKHK